MTRLDRTLAELATMSVAQLRERWNDIDTGPVPALPTPLLRCLIAQRLQEKRYGTLPLLVVRELERVGSPSGLGTAPVRKTIALTPGTRLIREWNGQTIAVEVREDGFLWNEQLYRSLSQIARKVTAAHWSGPRFFGLVRNG